MKNERRQPLRTWEEAKIYLLQNCIPQPNGCWEWSGRLNGGGYGTKRFCGKKWGVHALAHAAFSDRAFVPGYARQTLHSCHNRKCINPRHLSAGTSAQNRHDSVVNGTHNRSKIPPQDVLAIRELFSTRQPRGTKKALAAKYGVDRHMIGLIISGKTWGWL